MHPWAAAGFASSLKAARRAPWLQLLKQLGGLQVCVAALAGSPNVEPWVAIWVERLELSGAERRLVLWRMGRVKAEGEGEGFAKRWGGGVRQH